MYILLNSSFFVNANCSEYLRKQIENLPAVSTNWKNTHTHTQKKVKKNYIVWIDSFTFAKNSNDWHLCFLRRLAEAAIRNASFFKTRELYLMHSDPKISEKIKPQLFENYNDCATKWFLIKCTERYGRQIFRNKIFSNINFIDTFAKIFVALYFCLLHL